MKKFEEFEQRIIQKEEERIKALKDKDMWYNKSVALEKEFNQFQETGLLQKSSKFKVWGSLHFEKTLTFSYIFMFSFVPVGASTAYNNLG